MSHDSSNTPLGLVLLYSSQIDTVNYNNLEAVIYYYRDQGDFANVWIDNSGSLILNSDYSRKTNFISPSDIFRLNHVENFSSTNILLFIDQTNLQSTPHYTDFQAKIDKEYASVVDGGGGGMIGPDGNPVGDPGGPGGGPAARTCDEIDPIGCAGMHNVGNCIYKERQNGPPTTSCPNCSTHESANLLSNNSTPLDSSVIPNIYDIKNNILFDDNKFHHLIDDYYYVSSKIVDNLDLSIAWELYELSDTEFFKRFKNFNNPSYADTVLIDSTNKTNLLNLCNDAKSISTDSEADNILDGIITDINNYENKTISYIKANY